ncbi:hypothetical protein [Thermus scotoductus]|uniref:hypothetical protein n=1 Tax=Thermus scotoductus TaxID=37636 RepID=UPI0020A52569|nr:hypothetical protein [Thermus scotoductus]
MKGEQGEVVTIRYIRQVEGDGWDEGGVSYVGGHGNLIRGLEAELEGREEGEIFQARGAAD